MSYPAAGDQFLLPPSVASFAFDHPGSSSSTTFRETGTPYIHDLRVLCISRKLCIRDPIIIDDLEVVHTCYT
jgi:hypothetical protein